MVGNPPPAGGGGGGGGGVSRSIAKSLLDGAEPLVEGLFALERAGALLGEEALVVVDLFEEGADKVIMGRGG